MDLQHIITGLRGELNLVKQIISSVELLAHLQGVRTPTGNPDLDQTLARRGRSRRGRKSMGLEERKQVSERMKKYWAGRREARRKGGPK